MNTGQVFVSHTSDMAEPTVGRSFVQAAFAEGILCGGLLAVHVTEFIAGGLPADARWLVVI
jgi:hypothetical protein